jgi:hypothetical protein
MLVTRLYARIAEHTVGKVDGRVSRCFPSPLKEFIMALTDSVRLAIVKFALDQEAAGAHYLWGSAGEIPDTTDSPTASNSRKAVFMEPSRLTPSNPSVMAAKATDGGAHVCAGRYHNIKGGGGRTFSPADRDLIDYLKSLGGIPEASWQPFCGKFTPRIMSGSTVETEMVWGEQCKGIRHFDCVGFINWCFSMGSNSQYQYSMAQYANYDVEVIKDENTDAPLLDEKGKARTEVRGINQAGGTVPSKVISGWVVTDRQNQTRTMMNDPEVKPADIVLRPGHIGLCTGAGEVVHASQAIDGVIRGPYKPAGWSYRIRLA